MIKIQFHGPIFGYQSCDHWKDWPNLSTFSSREEAINCFRMMRGVKLLEDFDGTFWFINSYSFKYKVRFLKIEDSPWKVGLNEKLI